MSMKNLVIEMHELIPYAMNAANSGEFGEVKNITIGGIPRAVMSSQAIKYAVRNTMAENNLRTNYYVNEIVNKCFDIDNSLSQSADFVKHVLGACGIALKGVDKKDKKTSKDTVPIEVENLLNGIGVKSSTTEVTSRAEIEDIAKVLVDSYNAGNDEQQTKKKLEDMDRMIDLWTAAFGRMSTNAMFKTVEGAVQTSMSYSVDAFLHQNDYFSVIDSLQKKYDPQNAGAANLQDKSVSANLMYRYINISVGSLIHNYRLLERITNDNIREDKEAQMFASFVSDLLIHFCYCHPVAKQHSMASMPTPAAVAIFTGKNIFTCTMDSAFNKVVQASHNKSTIEEAASRLIKWTDNDMIVDQYDSAIAWVPDTVEPSTSIETRTIIRDAYTYAKTSIYDIVMDYIIDVQKAGC